MLSLRVCMNLGMLMLLLVSRDTLFCIGKEMERSIVTRVVDAMGTKVGAALLGYISRLAGQKVFSDPPVVE